MNTFSKYLMKIKYMRGTLRKKETALKRRKEKEET